MGMSEQDYLEFRFVQASLKKYGFELKNLMEKDIDDKDLIQSTNLQTGISFEVKRAGYAGGVLKFTFPSYGRFIEIHYFKKRNNSISSLRNDATNTIWGIRKKSRAKKDTRWYTHNVFGLLNELIGELMYGFTESVRLNMRKQLIEPYRQ
jgi:hypothetical protein